MVEAIFILTPALGLLAAKYSDMPYATITLLSTLPNLIALPTGILAGVLIKKKVGFKPLVTFSILLVIIGGIIPYFVTSFGSWILARCLFGVGFGLVSPLGATMVGMFYRGEQSVKIQGLGSVVQNVSGTIMQLLSGWVCLINVDYVWILHIIFIVPLIVFLIGYPNKEDVLAVTSTPVQEVHHTKSQLPGKVWLICLLFGLGVMCVFGFLLNVASFMQNEGIGSVGLVGIVAAMYTIGGVAAGFAFPILSKMLKRALIPTLFIITGIGMVIGYFGNNGAMLCMASFIIGFAYLMIWPANVVRINMIVEPQNMGLAMGVFIGAINVFGFAASSFIQVVFLIMGNNTRNPVIVGAIGLFIIGIFYIFANFKKEF